MQKTKIQLAVLVAITAGTAFGQAPVISSAAPNLAVNPPTLTIYGHNFGAVQPTVTLGGTPLTIQSFTQLVVVATLRAGANQGSYPLVLVNNLGLSVTFDVTLGATGPVGPAGPPGSPGPA